MGINLVVYRRRAGQIVDEVPFSSWDSGRYHGDREFAREVLLAESMTIAERSEGIDGEWYFRPRVAAAWKDWDAAFSCNHGRWAGLADLLESDPELWVYQSL